MTHRNPPIRSSTTTSLSPPLVCFTNCLLCLHGELLPQDLYFSPDTGLITPNYYFRADNVTRLDLGGRIVAPGFIEVQSNGMGGVHFTNLGKESAATDGVGDGGSGGREAGSSAEDEANLAKVARMYLSSGVTAFYTTVPTVPRPRWKQILPLLKPRCFSSPHRGADLLGAHVEGPYLHPVKKGAHNDAYFVKPEDDGASPEQVYGEENLRSEGSVRMITLAPELPGSVAMIGHLQERYPHVVISMGHSTATYADGLAAIDVGARALTHTFNAMPALNHRSPGLAGLMAGGRVWYSVIPDGIHVHPALLAIALRTNPSKCVLITDSIELAGLEDGVHEGHGQIGGRQRKEGNRVTLEGTDTLVGSCIRLDECVRNMVSFTGCGVAEAVRCVTENVADMMTTMTAEVEGYGWEGAVDGGIEGGMEGSVADVRKRGMLEPGRRADFVVLSAGGEVEETWMGGEKVWKRGDLDGDGM